MGNIKRFPENFCFQLTKEEYENLIFQTGISSQFESYGGRRTLPYVYTESGVAMLTSALHTDLTHAKTGIDITIISDNKGYSPLRLTEYTDFQTEYPGMQIKFIKTQNKVHDRFIILDYGTKSMKVYLCGSSSKDSGNKITAIIEIKEIDVYKECVKALLSHPALALK